MQPEDSNANPTPMKADGVPIPHVSSARDEHVRKATFWSSLTVVKDDYGTGTYMYFMYVKYIAVFCFLLSIPALVGYYFASDALFNQYEGVELLFFAAYPNSSVKFWRATTIISSILAIGIGPLYQYFQRHAAQLWVGEEREEELHAALAYIPENRSITSAMRRKRRFISILLFAIVIAAQGFATWAIHTAWGSEDGSILALLSALFLVVMQQLWKRVGKRLTKFERHKTWTSYREWDTGKMFFLKTMNLLVLYIVKAAAHKKSKDDEDCTLDSDNFVDCACPLRDIAIQFLIILALDVTFANIAEIVFPLVLYKIRSARSRGSGVGDEQIKPRFDVAEETVEVMYRMQVILLGMTVFPLITLIGAFTFILEWILDKYRLVTLCQKPTSFEEPLRFKLVFACHIFISLVALFSYPVGAIFIWMEENIGETCNVFNFGS